MYKFFLVIFSFLSTCFLLFRGVSAKYVEGRLKTLDDWAFVARFCFLSGKGRYEYHIEFERRFGEPQLLLYYDDKSQWPSVYKTKKTCVEKLSVLNVLDNQIVTLSARTPYSLVSGCVLRTSREEFEPTGEFKPPIRLNPTKGPTDQLGGDINFTHYDQFLKPTTESTTDDIDDNVTTLGEDDSFSNDTVVFNATEQFSFPVGTDIGQENKIENNTKYMDYAEEIFGKNSNGSTEQKIRAKRGFFSRDGSRGTIIVSCNSAGGFLTSRERWWYIAIANCGSKKGIDVKYKFRMTNGPPGDFWHEHFSADEMYIPPILFTQTLIYTFLLLAIFVCSIELKTRHLFHCTYRLFALSASLQYMGVLVSGVAWAKYAITGRGPYTTFGTLLQGASETVFLTVLLLMGKGYTITRGRLSTCSTIKLTIFINLYIVAYIALFIYREEVFDPGEVLNLYESPAGLGLSGLRSAAWGAFLVSIITTVRKFPEKANFYYPFGILGSTWILGGPILTLIGISFFDAWVRESVMCAVFAVLTISGHASFLWLTWPSRANQSFPYHVRTNHVGVISTEDDGTDYPRHLYEASRVETDQNIIIPLSRRTEDLLNSVYGQYLQEQEFYNSNSTPHSHVSFPLTNSGMEANMSNNTRALNASDASSLKIDDEETDAPDPEIQADSGHLSLENTSTPQSCADSPTIKDEKVQLPVPQPLKNNPFLINGVKNGPNKIILEPIRLEDSRPTSSVQSVPRHLFAARKSMDDNY